MSDTCRCGHPRSKHGGDTGVCMHTEHVTASSISPAYSVFCPCAGYQDTKAEPIIRICQCGHNQWAHDFAGCHRDFCNCRVFIDRLTGIIKGVPMEETVEPLFCHRCKNRHPLDIDSIALYCPMVRTVNYTNNPITAGGKVVADLSIISSIEYFDPPAPQIMAVNGVPFEEYKQATDRIEQLDTILSQQIKKLADVLNWITAHAHLHDLDGIGGGKTHGDK